MPMDSNYRPTTLRHQHQHSRDEDIGYNVGHGRRDELNPTPMSPVNNAPPNMQPRHAAYEMKAPLHPQGDYHSNHYGAGPPPHHQQHQQHQHQQHQHHHHHRHQTGANHTTHARIPGSYLQNAPPITPNYNSQAPPTASHAHSNSHPHAPHQHQHQHQDHIVPRTPVAVSAPLPASQQHRGAVYFSPPHDNTYHVSQHRPQHHTSLMAPQQQSNFYDPTNDSTRSRQLSETSWHKASPTSPRQSHSRELHEPYRYPNHASHLHHHSSHHNPAERERERDRDGDRDRDRPLSSAGYFNNSYDTTPSPVKHHHRRLSPPAAVNQYDRQQHLQHSQQQYQHHRQHSNSLHHGIQHSAAPQHHRATSKPSVIAPFSPSAPSPVAAARSDRSSRDFSGLNVSNTAGNNSTSPSSIKPKLGGAAVITPLAELGAANKNTSIESIINPEPIVSPSSSNRHRNLESPKLHHPVPPEVAVTSRVPVQTPSRAAQLMSFNNILSATNDQPASPVKPSLPVKPLSPPLRPLVASQPIPSPRIVKNPSPLPMSAPSPPSPAPVAAPTTKAPAEKKERAPRKSRAKQPKEPNTSTHRSRKSAAAATAADVNGSSALKGSPATLEKDKAIKALLAQLDGDKDDTYADLRQDRHEWQERNRRRRRDLDDDVGNASKLRKIMHLVEVSNRLNMLQDDSCQRYRDIYNAEATWQVRQAEIIAEKERKKDMQRKRRREKSMAATMEQKAAALAKARAAEDETERQKHLREAERASKKVQHTKLILEKDIKGPARGISIAELEPSFAAETADMPPIPGPAPSKSATPDPVSKKSKAQKGSRPKKSKLQKQAEIDAAVRAQAAIDAGLDLPPPRDEGIKLKLKLKPKEVARNLPDNDDTDAGPAGDVASDAGGDSQKVVVDDEQQPAKTKASAKKKKEEAPPEKYASKGYHQIYEQIWRDMARKDVTKTFKIACDANSTRATNLKKTAILAAKEAKRWQTRTNKGQKDIQARAKRVMRDMMTFWKRNEREERDLRKAAEKQELENARQEEAKREAARQKRKLNFLISQTELYSHFIGKKIRTEEVERSTDRPELAKAASSTTAIPQPDDEMPDLESDAVKAAQAASFETLNFDDEDESTLKAVAAANAKSAIADAQQKARAFNQQGGADMDEDGEMNFQNPTGLGDVDIEQPKLLNCQLKEYQLKGLNWLANLYEQGINGILADEMGLGKTVQSISVMAYLAEKYDIWGPFLVVSPASTLHNWQQEIAKFVPEFKILPYWGSTADRKVLRKFWDRKPSAYKKDAGFHVMVTSYQLVVGDAAYLGKMRWQYMILDEAQAIKSSESSRWKSLLGFHCRNRLLLTGTPIQNNMQELWALLHFIMPTLFDSHDEFSEWFSKDIESHAQSNTTLNEDQLKRLHMILKPFMLRRVKKHVQKELGDKIEKDVFCQLTYRQRAYYNNLRNQISIMDLIEKATIGDDNDSSTLMNLVMQFRKVCNHPDLFERSETTSPFAFAHYAVTGSFVRQAQNRLGYSTRNLIEVPLPRLLWCGEGRLDRPSAGNPLVGHRRKILRGVWAPSHIHENMLGRKAFSFLRFSDISPAEASRASSQDLLCRAAAYVKDQQQSLQRLRRMAACYEGNFTPAYALFMIRAQKDAAARAEMAAGGVLARLLNISKESWRDRGFSLLDAAARPRAIAPPIEVFCSSSRAIREREDTLFNVPVRRILYGPNPAEEAAIFARDTPRSMLPVPRMLPAPDNERTRFTHIAVPSMRRFVTDSGKLAKLDELLFKLKEGGHRVLLYFQMTRMIDLMEEYLTYRNWKYCRLDGSTKLEDRRDTVHDFQTRPEIFIFLLSTRAGGLGINLTSADTVIFYDSDWNPTIDSQAMDRAHRLGQTKQVTVYRLITKGTIEERIRKRALQKEEVQRVVIQGGSGSGAAVDFSGRRAPENRNRDIAMWLADDEEAELIEKREKELLESGEYDKSTKKRGGKRKRTTAGTGAVSLDDMYHEGEGCFDDADKPPSLGTPSLGQDSTVNEVGLPKPKRAKKEGGKKAKTLKQRLAIADGDVDA